MLHCDFSSTKCHWWQRQRYVMAPLRFFLPLSLWRHIVGFVFSFFMPFYREKTIENYNSLILILILSFHPYTSFPSPNLLSPSSPSPLAPAVRPGCLSPCSTANPPPPPPSLSHSRRGCLAGKAVGAAGQFSILDVRPQIGTQACG